MKVCSARRGGKPLKYRRPLPYGAQWLGYGRPPAENISQLLDGIAFDEGEGKESYWTYKGHIYFYWQMVSMARPQFSNHLLFNLARPWLVTSKRIFREGELL